MQYTVYARLLSLQARYSRLYSTKVNVSKLYYDRRSVGQSVLVSGTSSGTATNLSSFLSSVDSCKFVYVGHRPWREVGAVAYNCCWASPAQSFSYSSSTGLVTIFLLPQIWEPQPGSPSPIFISTRNRAAQLYPTCWVVCLVVVRGWYNGRGSVGQSVFVLPPPPLWSPLLDIFFSFL
jgi:hypothetical protein